jgi:hypothetical protein
VVLVTTVKCGATPNGESEKKCQIPPDLVVKTQAIDIAEVIS